jgi:hypothetical protein
MVQHCVQGTVPYGLGSNVLRVISTGQAQLLSNILQGGGGCMEYHAGGGVVRQERAFRMYGQRVGTGKVGCSNACANTAPQPWPA